jgi:LacI family transcriptional regulator
MVVPRLNPIPRILLLVETSRAYGRRIVEGIARYSLEYGPWSIHFEERGYETSPPSWLKEWRGDGIISRTINMKLAKFLKETGLPIVELLGDDRIGLAQVRMDVEIGSRMILDHFMKSGLRHFAYCTYAENWWTQLQSESFRKLVESHGAECRVYRSPAVRQSPPVWHEKYRRNLHDWLLSLPRPIGIFAAADLHAVRLLEICKELGIAVPEEMSILGVGNDPIVCETVRPTLTSLDLDGRRVGYEAAKLLDRKMSGKPADDTVICVPPSQLVVRQSTNYMAIDDPDVVQAMQFIRDYACKGINVYRVAEEVGVSRRALERRFQQHLGTSPKEEIMRCRIEYAKTLLGQTDQLNEVIARKCGFASLAYFTTAFRRETGTTPNAYRRARRVSRELGKE